MNDVRRTVARAAGEGVALGWATSEWLADRVVRVVRRGRRVLGEREAVRARRLRRANRYPLPNLWEVHPEARVAQARELGFRSVALDEIAGTAVAGPAQRGRDFLPLPRFRSANWRARWQRIRGAVDRLELLPPVDLVKYGGRYWVTDGHNRVAAALYSGGVEIDAVVTALVPPGAALDDTPATLAEMAVDSRALRAAGSGHWTSTASPDAIEEASAAMDPTQDRRRPGIAAEDQGAGPAQRPEPTAPTAPAEAPGPAETPGPVEPAEASGPAETPGPVEVPKPAEPDT